MDPRAAVKEIFSSALKAVDPRDSVLACGEFLRDRYRRGGFRRLHVVGFGKAACPMAKAVEETLPVDSGMVITKYGHCLERFRPARSRVHEAGHPVPDTNGLKATEAVIESVKGLAEDAMVVCLISGGGSSLLVAPCSGITLDQKREVTELLLRAGADIYELNTVRKHLSRVKGGRLAGLIHPAETVSLILSDVVGDRVDLIASGPTSPDPSTYQEAMDVLKRHRLLDRTPELVLQTLLRGVKGEIPETPKAGAGIFDAVENVIIGSNRKALEAGRERAEGLGIPAEVLTSELTGEAREAALWLSAEALERKRAGERVCLLSGGETTVTVRGKGRGGRNTEFALAFAISIEGVQGITLLSAGTDGTDGPTDAAGAVVDGASAGKARTRGLDPVEFLDNNDSYTLFRKTGDLLITGPTGTNVMDIQIVLIE